MTWNNFKKHHHNSVGERKIMPDYTKLIENMEKLNLALEEHPEVKAKIEEFMNAETEKMNYLNDNAVKAYSEAEPDLFEQVKNNPSLIEIANRWVVAEKNKVKTTIAPKVCELCTGIHDLSEEEVIETFNTVIESQLA